MITVIITCFSLFISFMALVYLRNSDPKLRRVYRLSGWGTKRYVKDALVICFAPGLILLVLGKHSEFIMWFAALSLIGWAIAVKKPKAC